MLIKKVNQEDFEKENMPEVDSEDDVELVSAQEIIDREAIVEHTENVEKEKNHVNIIDKLKSIFEKKEEKKTSTDQLLEKQAPDVEKKKLNISEDEKIEQLVEMGLKNFDKALGLAKKEKSPYAIDKFHDESIKKRQEDKTGN